MTVIGEWSLPDLISTHKPFIIFSLLFSSEERGDRAAWWASGLQPGSTHHKAAVPYCQPTFIDGLSSRAVCGVLGVEDCRIKAEEFARERKKSCTATAMPVRGWVWKSLFSLTCLLKREDALKLLKVKFPTFAPIWSCSISVCELLLGCFAACRNRLFCSSQMCVD